MQGLSGTGGLLTNGFVNLPRRTHNQILPCIGYSWHIVGMIGL